MEVVNIVPAKIGQFFFLILLHPAKLLAGFSFCGLR